MDTKEAVKLKQDLECDILKLIQDFEKKTGLSVSHVQTGSVTEYGGCTHTYGVELEVRL